MLQQQHEGRIPLSRCETTYNLQKDVTHGVRVIAQTGVHQRRIHTQLVDKEQHQRRLHHRRQQLLTLFHFCKRRVVLEDTRNVRLDHVPHKFRAHRFVRIEHHDEHAPLPVVLGEKLLQKGRREVVHARRLNERGLCGGQHGTQLPRHGAVVYVVAVVYD